MNRRTAITLTDLSAVAVAAGEAFFYSRSPGLSAKAVSAVEDAQLARPDSPSLGPTSAPVTVVEFFDPSCKACQAFYPFVKQLIMTASPQDVCVVLRYTTLHPASEEAVRILEAARKQDHLQGVLEWLLQSQAQWGADGNPKPDCAWGLAQEAGLDLARARPDAVSPEVGSVLAQDVADVKTVGISGTPMFFINGKPLPSFGAQQLADLVQSEAEASKKP